MENNSNADFGLMSEKDEFIQLLKDNVTREGAKVDALINKLCSSDFFVAPASSRYHLAEEGGLCKHSLNVFYNLMHLFKYKYGEEVMNANVESITIVALLHDISKMNFYEVSYRNVKVYSEHGDKRDNNGKFSWESVQEYKTKEANDRFIFGSHEATSEFMVRQFIPLKVEESVAIMHHMGGKAWDSAQDNIAEVYNKYQLATLLHCADLLATYIDERA